MALNVKTSLVDLMKSKGMDSSWDARVKYANENGIKNYSGTAAQNKQMMNIINSSAQDTQKAAEQNVAKTAANQPVPSVQKLPYTGQDATMAELPYSTYGEQPNMQNLPLDLSQGNVNQWASLAPAQNPIDVRSIYEAALANAGAAPTYQSNYQAQLDGLLAQIANREAFSYDQASDPMYQQYRDQYTANGNKAMRDTMGNAAAMTGGYGNSYAATAGSQAYDAYMEGLNNVGMELYDRAYGRYQDEGANLMNQYNAYASAEDQAYQRYLQEYAMWGDQLNLQLGIADAQIGQANTDRDYALTYNQYLEGLRQNEIANEQWKKQFDYNAEQDEKSWKYQDDRDKVADSQWEREFGLAQIKGASPSDDTGYTQREIDNMRTGASRRIMELRDNMANDEDIIAAVYLEYPYVAEEVLLAMGYLMPDDVTETQDIVRNTATTRERGGSTKRTDMIR